MTSPRQGLDAVTRVEDPRRGPALEEASGGAFVFADRFGAQPQRSDIYS